MSFSNSRYVAGPSPSELWGVAQKDGPFCLVEVQLHVFRTSLRPARRRYRTEAAAMRRAVKRRARKEGLPLKEYLSRLEGRERKV